jgi:hypothetical protein
MKTETTRQIFKITEHQISRKSAMRVSIQLDVLLLKRDQQGFFLSIDQPVSNSTEPRVNAVNPIPCDLNPLNR